MNMGTDTAFDGSKIAVFIGEKLAVILRDDIPGLPYPGYWDLPGGGREGDETPFACGQRECLEELGIEVPAHAILWSQSYLDAGMIKWFFVAQLPASTADHVVFGDEGQRWALMTPAQFLSHDRVVPAFQDRLQAYFDAADGAQAQKT